MSVEGLKVGDVVEGDASSTIKEGKIIAFTADGNAVVEITVVGYDQNKEIGDLYLINKKYRFYNKKATFFSIGKAYENKHSSSSATYTIKDLYQVGGDHYAVAVLSASGRKDTLVILSDGDFAYLREAR